MSEKNDGKGNGEKVVKLPIKNTVRRDRPRFDRCVVLNAETMPFADAEKLRFDMEVQMGVSAITHSVEGRILLKLGPHMFDMEDLVEKGKVMRDRIMQASGRG